MGVSYFEEYGIPVQEQVTDFVAKGIIHEKNMEYYDEYSYRVCDWDTKIKELSRTNIGNGYEKIVFSYEASTELVFDCLSYYGYVSAKTFNIGLYDKHTGVMLKARDISGNDGFSSVTPITFKDKEYNISYSKTASWEEGEWEYYESEEEERCRVTVTVVNEIEVPAGYDGLIFGVFPVTEYYTSDSTSIDEEIYYAPTELDEGYMFYRINP